jgi:hypothetical protein
MVVSLVVAEEQKVKTDGQTPVTTGSSDGGKEGSKQTFEVPYLLRLVPGESEADKLKRMAQFIKENRPRSLRGFKGIPRLVPKWQCAFCRQFMEDLVQMRNIEAIEPDFVTGSDEPEAWNEVTDKLNLKHCEDIDQSTTSIVPGDANPELYYRGGYGFNYISDIGGPPYRFYNIQLVPGKKTKYPVIYSDSSRHSGFTVLDLKKCEIEGEVPANSEKSREYEIGRNVLVRYKREVFALLLAYSSRDSYRLDLYGMGTERFVSCPWHYYGNARQDQK